MYLSIYIIIYAMSEVKGMCVSMNKLLSFSFCFMGLVLIMTACGLNKKEKSVDLNEYNNDVFTRSLYNSLEEVHFWYGDEDIVIKNETDIKNIFNQLSSLELTKASEKDDYVYGYIIINIVTKDKTIIIGLLSKEIVVDDQRYYIDKDIVDSIRKIALKYKK